jgi:hypothetical protein
VRVAAITKALVEQRLQIHVRCMAAAVTNISHQLRLNEGLLGRLSVSRPEGQIEVQVHLLLMDPKVEQTGFVEPRAFEDQKIQEGSLGGVMTELEHQLRVNRIDS